MVKTPDKIFRRLWGAFYLRYDGGAIGGFLRDALQNISGAFTLPCYSTGNSIIYPDDRLFTMELGGTANMLQYTGTGELANVRFNAGRVVNTANETRGASVSAWIGITY
jgi:hypothetical protein